MHSGADVASMKLNITTYEGYEVVPEIRPMKLEGSSLIPVPGQVHSVKVYRQIATAMCMKPVEYQKNYNTQCECSNAYKCAVVSRQSALLMKC